MTFVRYNGKVGVVAKSGEDLIAENPGTDLDDHLGLWFGEVDESNQPVVWTIPAEYVHAAEAVLPIYQH